MSKFPPAGKSKDGATATSDTPQDKPDAEQAPAAPRDPAVTNAGPSRIIGSQAKKQEEVTRQGTQKMKFVPTLPVRRKKPDAEVKQEEAAATLVPPKATERGRGRGRGRGLGRGRGGPPPPRQEMQMTASGPFAMGPALAGSSKRRVPRSNFVMPSGPGSTSLGDGLSRSAAPVLGQERDKAKRATTKEDDGDVEVYSDPDDGVQIVDMDAIKTMDWMAPESLRRERDEGNNSKKRKAEAVKKDAKSKANAKDGFGNETVETVVKAEVEKNLANALDLSESEEEEEMEDLIEDFAMENADMEDEDSLTRQEKLYFFQFPQPFPTFSLPSETEAAGADAIAVDPQKSATEAQKPNVPDKGKKVSFAQDVKPPAPNGAPGNKEKNEGSSEGQTGGETGLKPAEEKKLDGIIGRLEVHRSGLIKMRLGNGMLMDVTAATQPSFLQHAVFLDPAAKKMHVLGEVNRRFVVSPDVDELLEEMDKAEAAASLKTETTDIPMDTS